MKFRSMAIGVVFLIIVASISVGGTFAYLTSNKSVQNTFTVGNVDIKILEEQWDNDVQNGSNNNIVPGFPIKKDPKVVNNGVNPCYVRLKVLIPKGQVNNNYNTEIFEIGGLNTTDWTYNGGYYYYNSALEAGEETSTLFETATLKSGVKEGIYKSTPNNLEGNKVMIDVFAEAIQSQGFSSSAEAWQNFSN